ncbi:MAG: glycosyltransferase family 4 protein [Opitutae bacterium]|nr:glycosyltransferase family 4 protein [Opitutae bacterium]
MPVKEWEVLMRAMAALPDELPLRVRHAGAENGTAASAAYARSLRALAEELRLDSRWEWSGEIADLASFYGRVDCLVVVSPWEASSMAALEAIAAGVPVLAHVASGTTDLVARTTGGWTFKDEHDLVTQLRELAHGDRLARWRRNDEGLDFFSARRVAAEHERFYRRLLNSS